MRQNQVLFVTDADFAERVAVGEVGDRVHLFGGSIAGRAAFRLQRERHDGVARDLVIGDRIAHPSVEAAIGAARVPERGRIVGEPLISGIDEAASDLGEHGWIERKRAVLDVLPLRVDFLGERFRPEFVHQDFDARLVNVVAPDEFVVGAQNRLDVAQDVALVQERLDRLGEERRTAEPAADHDLETDLAGAVAVQPQGQIVDRQCGAVVTRCADGDLELARQE